MIDRLEVETLGLFAVGDERTRARGQPESLVRSDVTREVRHQFDDRDRAQEIAAARRCLDELMHPQGRPFLPLGLLVCGYRRCQRLVVLPSPL